MIDGAMETTSLRFAEVARLLGEAARDRGLEVPAFRSPPRSRGATRTIRRRPGGQATVSVALRDRPWPAVVADLIEGVLAANRLDGPAAGPARDALWAAVADRAGGVGPPPARASPPAGGRRPAGPLAAVA
jgi:hypothetical protein